MTLGYGFCNLLIINNLLASPGSGKPLFVCKNRTFRLQRELVPRHGVQRSEDARNLTSLRARRRSPGDLEQPPGNRCRKISVVPFHENVERWKLAEKNVEVCDVARAQKSFCRNP
jgi:hypothetical protein